MPELRDYEAEGVKYAFADLQARETLAQTAMAASAAGNPASFL